MCNKKHDDTCCKKCECYIVPYLQEQRPEPRHKPSFELRQIWETIYSKTFNGPTNLGNDFNHYLLFDN